MHVLLASSVMPSWRSAGGEAEIARVLSLEARRLATPRPVGRKAPHSGAQLSLPADYRLWQGP